MRRFLMFGGTHYDNTGGMGEAIAFEPTVDVGSERAWEIDQPFGKVTIAGYTINGEPSFTFTCPVIDHTMLSETFNDWVQDFLSGSKLDWTIEQFHQHFLAKGARLTIAPAKKGYRR